MLENRRYRLHGSVVLRVAGWHWAWSAAVILFVSLTVIYLATGSYVRKERVRGFIAPDHGVVKILPNRQGLVGSCAVESGDLVDAGDDLCVLVDRHGLPGEKERNRELLRELRQKEERIEGFIEQWRAVFRLERDRLESELAIAVRREEAARELLRTFVRQEKLLEERRVAAETLRQEGHLSANEYRQLASAALEKHGETQRARQELQSAESAIARLRKELERQPLEWELKRAELQEQLSDVARAVIEIEGRRNFVVRSPVRGKVTAFQAVIGQAVDPAVPLMAILPESSKMVATLLVPGRAIGFVTRGMEVQLRYAGFPYQRYGTYRGRIAEVSLTTLSPRELAQVAIASEPVYRVLVELERDTVSAYGKAVPLQAGMLLEADIIQDRRTLLEWLVDPVLRFRGVT